MNLITPVAILVLVIFFLSAAIRILNEYERGVIFRLGRVITAKGPGLIILIPVIDKIVKVSLRLVAMDVDPQDVITRDNVSVKVNAVIYFRVIDPTKAIVEVENYTYAMSQLAQTTLRSVCGQAELDELLALRQRISIWHRLRPLTWRESADYIRHRVQVAHVSGTFKITGPACLVAHRYSRGVPRRLNQISDRALLAAFSLNRLKVDASLMRRAAREVVALEML